MRLAYGIPGIRNWHRGTKTVGRLETDFHREGWDYRVLDYGYVFFLGMLFLNKRIAKLLAQTIQPRSTIVAHSNGCTIAALIAERGLPIRNLIMIQPALDRDWQPPACVDHMHVFWNRGDTPTLIASLLPWLKWGRMGRTGPSYQSPKVTSTDTGEIGYRGHSVEFKHIDVWGPKIVAAAVV